MPINFNSKTIILIIISAAVGFAVNYISTIIANNKLLKELQAELAKLQLIQAGGKTTLSENIKLEQKQIALEAQIQLLNG